jgi:hypothetical protein
MPDFVPWPDEKLEVKMLADADRKHPSHDLACHVKALLSRVRELEESVLVQQSQVVAMQRLEGLLRCEWLLHCEAAIKSMAAQFACPKTSPQELVADILSDRKAKKHADR